MSWARFIWILRKNINFLTLPVLERQKLSQVESARRLHDQQPYIFVYTTHFNDTIQRFIARLKKKTGLKVIKATYDPKQAIKQGILQVHTLERWLQLLRDAEYVVTNNVRMNDFLSEVALANRIYSRVPDCIEVKDIDYRETDNKIDSLRKEPMAFLRENLEEAYRQKITVQST